MANEIKIIINDENISTLLRSNLCCYLGKTITSDLLDEMTKQIIESLNYFLDYEDI
jgi:hypothetical protein